jgi:hypothetical protein
VWACGRVGVVTGDGQLGLDGWMGWMGWDHDDSPSAGSYAYASLCITTTQPASGHSSCPLALLPSLRLPTPSYAFLRLPTLLNHQPQSPLASSQLARSPSCSPTHLLTCSLPRPMAKLHTRATEQTPLLRHAYAEREQVVSTTTTTATTPTTRTTAVLTTAAAAAAAGDDGSGKAPALGQPGGSDIDDVEVERGAGAGTRAMTMTPIPWRQLLTLCLVRLVDPICFSQVFPYINDMLLDMRVVGPNEPERVGFYSGLIESTFSVAVALAIYPWARLSGLSLFPVPVPPSLSLSLSLSLCPCPRCGPPLSYLISPSVSRPRRTKTRALVRYHWCHSCDGQLWNGK